MKIHNIRLGFATNSSSLHSIIFTDDNIEDEDIDGDFGWNHFTAASLEAKKLYLAATLFDAVDKQVSTDIALSVVKDWVGVELTKDNYGGYPYIDHQSLFALPREWSGQGINKQFFLEFKDYLLQSGIVILGGNDNTEEEHPLAHVGTPVDLPIPQDQDRKHIWVARKDDSGYWSLFNRNTGAKVRFSFDELASTPVKSSVPELVDIKITDFCDQGCAFCYQGSTPEGIHAKTSDLSSTFYKLSQAEVFEVALGGGEPTEHPDFFNIISSCKAYNIVPNFTTKSFKWLEEPWARQVLDMCGGFAYSVTNHKQIPKFVEAMQRLNYPQYPKRLCIHYVLGSTPMHEYKLILEKAAKYAIQVTLLGFKTTGRGKEFKPHHYEKWLDIIKELRDNNVLVRIGIDTAIADQYDRTIQLMGISSSLYHTQEGKFSCYIDAVTKQMAPSSYAPRSEYKPFDSNWLETYSTF